MMDKFKDIKEFAQWQWAEGKKIQKDDDNPT